MKDIHQLLQEYGESHTHPTNKAIHFVCVPLIYFSIMGLIWDIPFPWHHWRLFGYKPNWAIVATGVVFVYYAMLSSSIAIGMTLFSIACLFLLRLLDYRLSSVVPVWAISGVIFILSWIGQFYGHKIEGKKPSFFKDIQFLLIGPAWILSFLLNKLNIRY